MTFGHLTGTVDVIGRSGVPEVGSLAGGPVRLPAVDILHAAFELPMGEGLAALPPALHPSIPAHLSLLVIRGHDGPFGPFTLAQVRVGCRAGMKPRGYSVAAWVDSPRAAEVLTTRWGYPCVVGEVELSVGDDRITARAATDGAGALDLAVHDTRSLAGTTVIYAPTLNLAGTPRGRRLVQCDIDVEFERVARGLPVLHCLDIPDGVGALTARQPVTATLAAAAAVLHPVRYILDPARPVGEGTELVMQGGGRKLPSPADRTEARNRLRDKGEQP